nr:ribonuclease H-like domain, reverse transcriptase, RNA-dependent DNA polymerase [Tanacetum cinerariifolium]
MSTVNFAKVHNMIALMSNPTESVGFKQIINFLNAHPIKYAVTVNLTIYTSCVEQFWGTTKAKNINGEAQLCIKVDGKKVVIFEASIRRDLMFGDEGGIACLSNETIFKQLSLMGYEKLTQKLTFYKAFYSSQWKFLIHTILQCLSAKATAWNEFSSTIPSAVICLATYKKFKFSKYVFDSMVKNLDSATKFLMFPRDSPLFPTIMVEAQEEIDEAVNEEMYDSLEKDTTAATSLDVEQDRGNVTKSQSKATPNELISPGTSSGGGPRRQNNMGISLLRLELCTKLSDRGLNLETTKITQAKEISSLKRSVKRLEKKKRSGTHGLKRLYKVGLSARVESSADEESLGKEDASKHGRISDIDANQYIYLVNVHRHKDIFGVNDQDDTSIFDADKDLQSEEVVVKEVNTSSIATCVTAAATTNIAQAKEISSLKRSVKRLEKKKRSGTHGLKRLYKVGLSARVESSADEESLGKEDASKHGRISDIDANQYIYLVNVHRHKDIFGVNDQDDTSIFDADKDLQSEEVVVKEVNTSSIATCVTAAATTNKVENDKEHKELKRCLEIVPDDGDDVTINATPLSSKSPTIIDYKIYKEGRKSFFQIIRADVVFELPSVIGIILSTHLNWKLDTPPPISQPANVLETSLVIDNIRGLVWDALGVKSLNLKSEESSESRLEGDIEVDIEEENEEEDIEEESEEDIGERPRVAPNSQQRNLGNEDIRYKMLLA